MLTKNRQCENPFTGRWKVVGRWRRVRGWGWAVSRICSRYHLVWEFSETDKITFPSGNTLFTGTLREVRKNQPPDVMNYSYSTEERRLHIERTNRVERGSFNGGINETYLVEPKDDGLMRIYCLEEVAGPTDKNRFILKLRRLKRL